MSRPYSPRSQQSSSFVRVNGKIRAREVRLIGHDGQQLGVVSLSDALNIARQQGVDLVEIASNATPPVCKVIDFGKYRYELSKKEKESKKHQHGNKVKEVQLSPKIDPHDFATKLQHAVDFLCDEMKVKVTLRFRGRENAHKEIGFQQVNNFIRDVSPFAQPDAPPKLIGKGINVMLSPLPKNKRAKNPKEAEADESPEVVEEPVQKKEVKPPKAKKVVPVTAAEESSAPEFANTPFSDLEPK
ncbi:MAG: translation initiation factor IF-3 [Verrucomicrobia bacterium]|nr:translation initiation factor IF-3 [Verrucomicrobiota bacterium]